MLEHFSEAEEQTDGRHVVLIFKEGMKDVIRDTLKCRDFDEDALNLAKVAKIIRKDILNHENFKFTGTFPPACQEQSIPSSLKYLLTMIMNGSKLKNPEAEKTDSKACLTIGQVILYNTKKKPSKSGETLRHTLEREPPLPIYIGMTVHSHTRSKSLIHRLYQMGLSVSYARVMQIEDWISTSACEQFEDDQVVA